MKLFFLLFLSAFIGSNVRGQPAQVYKCFCDKGGLCSSSLVLYADNSFVYEHGCEASSHLSFGEWRNRKDSVFFTQPDPKAFKVIKDVQSSIIPGDSIWITILDRKGINITSKISIGLDVPGKGSYLFSNDSSGARQFVYKRIGGSISLRTLSKLFGQKIGFPSNGANHFIVVLNISANWIWNNHADWAAFGNAVAVKRGKSLLFVSPHSAGVFDLYQNGD